MVADTIELVERPRATLKDLIPECECRFEETPLDLDQKIRDRVKSDSTILQPALRVAQIGPLNET